MTTHATTRQASLLRGINVGKANRIAMPALLAIYHGIGAHGARTVLNSGNVVLSHAEPPQQVSRLAEAAILGQLGVDLVVIGRSHRELAEIAAVKLFPDADGNRRFVVFLDGTPASAGEAALRAVATDREALQVVGRELHMHLRDGIGRSKLTLPLIEKRLRVRGTARNWNTVERLLRLTSEDAGGDAA